MIVKKSRDSSEFSEDRPSSEFSEDRHPQNFLRILRIFWGSSSSELSDPQKILRVLKKPEDEDSQKILTMPQENLKVPPRILRFPQ